MELKAFKILNDSNRNTSVDIFRCLAIVSVVIFHFNNTFTFGFLGVDLFFVISGLLVGGILTRQFEKGHNINFLKFFLERGFKIWPSYYFFLLIGGVMAFLFYHNSNPEQTIPIWDLKRYLFFYQNYTGVPFHWSFDHVWSLCVEEHFYVLLPIMFIVIQNWIKPEDRKFALFVLVSLTILTGIALKFISYYYTNSKDTYSATHNRVDALAWGVLLNLIIANWGERIKMKEIKFVSIIIGALIFAISLYSVSLNRNGVFEKIYFHSLIPISFFFVLMGSYYIDFSRLKIMRFIAYYSYNWYLWHPIFVVFITKIIGNTIVGLLTYLLVTFVLAIFSTVCIEEFFLSKRKTIISKIFEKEKM